ncbi:MAG TPA: glycosyltransferase [Bryobacteraceae bacterium]|jgi:glycosyltransferase involved in cell wall biosynthesis|nr:glycosyltransferase [Bryobacteraceae bacterium]
MNFVIMHESVVEYDAIGRDIIEMYNILDRRHRCYLYAEHLIGIAEKKRIVRSELDLLISQPSTAIVYHLSNYWKEGEDILERAVGPIVIKYHNITPPSCFKFHEPYWRACLQGREQTLRYFYKFPRAHWLADSAFNFTELGLGDAAGRTAVLPPFPTMTQSRGAQPYGALLRSLVESTELNILFSGRIVPNKGHKLLVRVLSEYVKRYGRNVRLNIVGKLDSTCQSYYDAVQAAIAAAGLADLISFLGSLTDSDLLAYYLGSDAYLCCSDHEGFCVPIVESQYCRLPVVAKAKAAIPETVGPGGLLFGEDPVPYAIALHRLHTDDGFRQNVVRAGYANYSLRFNQPGIEASFRREILKATGAEL